MQNGYFDKVYKKIINFCSKMQIIFAKSAGKSESDFSEIDETNSHHSIIGKLKNWT